MNALNNLFFICTSYLLIDFMVSNSLYVMLLCVTNCARIGCMTYCIVLLCCIVQPNYGHLEGKHIIGMFIIKYHLM